MGMYFYKVLPFFNFYVLDLLFVDNVFFLALLGCYLPVHVSGLQLEYKAVGIRTVPYKSETTVEYLVQSDGAAFPLETFSCLGL